MKKKINKKIAIIGSGALGTAFAKVLFDSGQEDLTIYGVDQDELSELSRGINTKYFPNSTELPNFKTENNLVEAVKDADYIVVAVPSHTMNIVMPNISGAINKDVLIINGSKGFYPGTHKSLHVGMTEAVATNENVRGIVSLIGPSHAEEIVKRIPTMVAAVDKKQELCKEVQTLFANEYFRVYVQTDVKGAEVGAAFKNVLAIASGIANGMGYGINSIAGLLTRGLVEMQTFNKLMKGKKETIYGLTGIGDLIVTATSNLSRNYSFGNDIAKNGIKKAMKNQSTIEGISALEHIFSIAKEKKIELPIVNFLYKIVFEEVDPKDFIEQLWKREFKSE